MSESRAQIYRWSTRLAMPDPASQFLHTILPFHLLFFCLKVFFCVPSHITKTECCDKCTCAVYLTPVSVNEFKNCTQAFNEYRFNLWDVLLVTSLGECLWLTAAGFEETSHGLITVNVSLLLMFLRYVSSLVGEPLVSACLPVVSLTFSQLILYVRLSTADRVQLPLCRIPDHSVANSHRAPDLLYLQTHPDMRARSLTLSQFYAKNSKSILRISVYKRKENLNIPPFTMQMVQITK